MFPKRLSTCCQHNRHVDLADLIWSTLHSTCFCFDMGDDKGQIIYFVTVSIWSNTVQFLFVFGDSYTSTGFNISAGVDSPVPGFVSH